MSDLLTLARARFQGQAGRVAVQPDPGGDDMPVWLVTPELLPLLGEFLRDEPEARYDLLLTLSGDPQQIDYILASLTHWRRLCLRVAPAHILDSLAWVWPAANWAERQVRDLAHVAWRHHPDPRPLLRPVEPLASRSADRLAAGCPQMDSIEGLFVDLEPGDLDGLVERAVPRLGYRHIGAEKRLTERPWSQGLLLTARLDEFSAAQADLAFALAVEKLLGIEPPYRAQYGRILYAEWQRMASHLFWLARAVRRLTDSAFVAPSCAWQGRLAILDMFRHIGGNPTTPDLIAVGGLRQDMPPGIEAHMRRLHADLTGLLDDLDELLVHSVALCSHLEGLGMLDSGTALGLGATGPCLRACGLDYDVRRFFPYSGYDRLNMPDVRPAAVCGDALSRLRVRMADLRVSLDWIRQALDRLMPGPVNALPDGLPPDLPAGSVYAAVESPRGELGMWLVSNGGSHLRLAHLRAPSLFNLSLLPLLTRNVSVEQVAVILDSLDVSIGEAER